MKFAKSFALLLVVLVLAFGMVSSVQAQNNEPTADDVNRIARELYCPVCENTPLDVCPTDACKQWRELIRQKLAEGWTDQQIKDYFVEYYGVRVLAEPPATGLNWLIYIVPPVIFLAGLVLLINTYRSWHAPLPVAEEAEQTIAAVQQDDYVARLEEELKKRD
jgi:cytochrome c-type biogenesis protein CcmH